MKLPQSPTLHFRYDSHAQSSAHSMQPVPEDLACTGRIGRQGRHCPEVSILRSRRVPGQGFGSEPASVSDQAVTGTSPPATLRSSSTNRPCRRYCAARVCQLKKRAWIIFGSASMSTLPRSTSGREWTGAFHEGSTYEGDWNEGDEIRFLGPNDDGTVATVAFQWAAHFLPLSVTLASQRVFHLFRVCF